MHACLQNFKTDPENCGKCGKNCLSLLGTGATCTNGECEWSPLVTGSHMARLLQCQHDQLAVTRAACCATSVLNCVMPRLLLMLHLLNFARQQAWPLRKYTLATNMPCVAARQPHVHKEVSRAPVQPNAWPTLRVPGPTWCAACRRPFIIDACASPPRGLLPIDCAAAGIVLLLLHHRLCAQWRTMRTRLPVLRFQCICIPLTKLGHRKM
jgi:hypothetical protein